MSDQPANYTMPASLALTQMYNISYGYGAFWIVMGTTLAFYVRAQTIDKASQSSYAW